MQALDTIPGYDATLEGAPSRYFVSPGEPAIDCCEQLTVHVLTLTETAQTPGGLSVGRRGATMRKNLVGLAVTVTRCVPMRDDGEPQAADVLELAADQINADGWALWNHLWEMYRAEQLFTLCGEVFWDGMRSLTPSGGCAGWVLTLRASLDGYDDVS